MFPGGVSSGSAAERDSVTTSKGGEERQRRDGKMGGARERLVLVAVKVADRSVGQKGAKGTARLPRWETGNSDFTHNYYWDCPEKRGRYNCNQ